MREDSLQHFGVKGMHWGHRKAKVDSYKKEKQGYVTRRLERKAKIIKKQLDNYHKERMGYSRSYTNNYNRERRLTGDHYTAIMRVKRGRTALKAMAITATPGLILAGQLALGKILK